MTALQWNQTGERRYETGVDRGVLYPFSGGAFPWNGLVSVAENRGGEVKSYYLDGVKYLDRYVPGSYAAKLSAFTYPDVLDALLGTVEVRTGIRVHDQPNNMFSLAYRTLIGNDAEGLDHGYRLHIVYNVRAKPSDFTYGTISDTLDASPFEWDLTGTPVSFFGIRPTAHISLDSRTIDPEILQLIEDALYGTDTDDPRLLSLNDLMTIVPEVAP